MLTGRAMRSVSAPQVGTRPHRCARKGTEAHNTAAEKKVALNRSARMGLTSIVSLLLDSGVDLHADSDAALQWAARYGHAETVKLLLEKGADVNAVHGEALRLAERFGHQGVRALLLEHQQSALQKRH